MIEALYLESVRTRFAEEKSLGGRTMQQLTAEQLLWQPNEASNSIALIVQHLHGNMLSRWTNFLTEDGEKEWRQRDAEFEPRALTADEVLALWEEGWSVLFAALDALRAEDLVRRIHIRAQPLTVVDAINRQLAHYSYHVGQIVTLGKWLRGNNWNSLSIARGQSRQFTETLKSGLPQ
ncbi:DUF1572 family protein [Flaviaesturariibacter amylovorans]|uniref:DUF1572 domain-containing protein n=1 Tax=Flaviaesturariibacter amylovorans TaxID=1084520 RepID=A0ABP8H136_9BACT